MDSYDTIAAPAAAEYIEKRSRFLSEIRPLSTEAELAAFLAGVRARHHDARHHCWACALREGGTFRCSDDGEPQGTAGVPMLEVLRREGLTDAGVVVTRYFGGILLGAGGLVRAYTHSAKLAVDAAARVRMRLCALLLLELPYALYDQIRVLLGSFDAVILDTAFTAAVTLRVRVRRDQLDEFTRRLTERSGGTLAPVPLGEEFAAL